MATKSHPTTSILILAAGSSSRLGRPKQLVDFRGKKLITHVIDECESSDIGEIYVVLGAHRESIQAEIISKSCAIIHNEHWRKGMSESIAFGIREICAVNIPHYIMLVLSDQPFISSSLLQSLHNRMLDSQSAAVLCQYKDGSGPPIIFHKRIFTELIKITGDSGAKEIINKYKDQISYINFPQGDVDIDTTKDIESLLNNQDI